MASATAVQSPHKRSEEHTSELPSLMRISYAVFCLKKTNYTTSKHIHNKITNHTTQQRPISQLSIITYYLEYTHNTNKIESHTNLINKITINPSPSNSRHDTSRAIHYTTTTV